MPIDTVGAAATRGVPMMAPTREPKQTMDGETFMTLLVTQLRNQDPSSPMDTAQMIGQITQLAMMEKLTALETTGQENFSLQMRTSAAALVGQQVSYTGTDGLPVTGTATSVSFARPVPQVTVGGVEIPLDAISGVVSPTAGNQGTTPGTTPGAVGGTMPETSTEED